MKRNQKVGGKFGTHDYRSKQFKALLDTCGLEWWNVSNGGSGLKAQLKVV